MSKWRMLLTILSALGVYAAACHGGEQPKPASETFDAKGVKIHYLVQGTGEPVVLIHGLYSSAAINWGINGVIADLAKDHQVIALDLPGHGESDKPDKEDAYGLKVIDDVLLLMDHLKVKQAHIVGYSLGGMIAMKLMATHPDRVLSGTVGGMGWLRDGGMLQKFWDETRPKTADEERGVKAFLPTIGQYALTKDELKKIDLPVKVIVGDRDPCQALYVEPLRLVRKDWPVAEIEGAGHLNCILKPQFREEVGAWVRKNSKPSSAGPTSAPASRTATAPAR